MLGIIRGREEMHCDICFELIEKGEHKIKDSQDNSKRMYYHLKCAPLNTIHEQLRLWHQALTERELNQQLPT